MNMHETPDHYGSLSEPTTLNFRRVLPGPIERVWSFLVDSDLRRRWLAAGTMEMRAGSEFEFVWRHDELSGGEGQRPAGFPAEHRMQSRIVEVDPPRRLVFTWNGSGDVTIDLEPSGHEVLLTLVHRRLRDRETTVKILAGWHIHIDHLAACLPGAATEAGEGFWDRLDRLKTVYDQRTPA